MSEYGLIGTLIVTVCIGVFAVVGGNLNTIMQQFKGNMSQQAQATSNAALAQTTERQAYEALRERINSQVILENGLAVKLQTTGANGTTMVYASQIENLAKQLSAEGKITAAQNDILMRLSNQSYRMAQMQAMLESSVQLANGNFQQVRTMRFNLDGNTYTAQQLAKQLGFDVNKPSHFENRDILTSYSQNAQPEMSNLLSLYQEADRSGVMEVPGVRNVVENATRNVATISESVEDILWEAFNQNRPIPDIDSFNNQVASATTQMNAGDICVAGDFSTDGNKCSDGQASPASP